MHNKQRGCSLWPFEDRSKLIYEDAPAADCGGAPPQESPLRS